MSVAEILAEIPNLSHEDRRRILDRIQEVEDEDDEAEELARLANESFQTLEVSEMPHAAAERSAL